MIRRLTRAIGCATASETGFTLVELIVTMSLMLVVLTAVSATFASGTHSETSASNRIRAESDARQALTTMRDDLHCSFAITSVTQNALGGFTLTMTEFYNTCKAVDQNSTSGSKVLLSWCTIPSPSNPNVFNLYRENTTCDTTGTRVVASDIVAPATGWPQNTAATGVGGSGSPTSWNGNIWPTSPICQLGYLQTQVVDVAVNPNYTKDPTSKYELKNTIALRNSTRCGTGTGTLAGPSLTLTVPSSSPKDTAINPSATVSGSSSETSPITFFYWKQPTAPTDCTTGGTTVGTANPAGDGTYPSSLSYTPTTTGDHLWWYATMSADSNNVAVASVCGSGMPTTTVTAAPVNPTLTVTAPGSASTGVAIAPTAIAGLLSGSSGATTGLITFYVIAQASAPAAGTCPTGMTTVGTASPTGDGTWNPSAGYTPASATTLWWFAKFAGDAGDNPASSACGPLTGMASTTVKTGQTISFTSTAPTAAKVSGSTYTATATATSGLAVTFTSATPSVCTAAGAVFTFIAEGTCTVNANQAGNGTYNAAPQVQQSFTVYSLIPTSLTIANGERHVAQGRRQRHDQDCLQPRDSAEQRLFDMDARLADDHRRYRDDERRKRGQQERLVLHGRHGQRRWSMRRWERQDWDDGIEHERLQEQQRHDHVRRLDGRLGSGHLHHDDHTRRRACPGTAIRPTPTRIRRTQRSRLPRTPP